MGRRVLRDAAFHRAGLCKRLQPVSSAATRASAALNHGSHMAASMALGLLFMGGGARTFSTRDEAVAALVIALYPRFPRATLDNRFHHQVDYSGTYPLLQRTLYPFSYILLYDGFSHFICSLCH